MRESCIEFRVFRLELVLWIDSARFHNSKQPERGALAALGVLETKKFKINDKRWSYTIAINSS